MDTLRIFTSTLYGKTKTSTNPNPDPNAMIQKKELQIKTEEDGNFKADKYKTEIEVNIEYYPSLLLTKTQQTMLPRINAVILAVGIRGVRHQDTSAPVRTALVLAVFETFRHQSK